MRGDCCYGYDCRAYSQFRIRYPDVYFHTYSGDADAVTERIDKGLSDMGLLLGPVRQEKYDYLNLHMKDIYGLLMPKDCPLSRQESINIDQLKSLPMILADQTFSGHQDLDWFGEDALNVVATYNLIYNATFLVEHGIGYALCLDRLVNTIGRNLTFRPISPELSVGLYIVTKKIPGIFSCGQSIFRRNKEKRGRQVSSHLVLCQEKVQIKHAFFKVGLPCQSFCFFV